VSNRIPSGKTSDIALDATLRAAAPFQLSRESGDMAVSIEMHDIREKVREKKIGNTIMFVVDSSGSMGASKRMTAAKGAVLSLLIDAYQKRDRVGLVAFKGDSAEVLLSPTSSVELAQKHLEVMPTGGKTPLSAGIARAYEVIKREISRDKNIKPMMVLISDGRANVSSSKTGDPFAECMDMAPGLRSCGIDSIVIDTESGFIRLSRLEELATALGGQYYLLSDLRAGTLSGIVRRSL